MANHWARKLINPATTPMTPLSEGLSQICDRRSPYPRRGTGRDEAIRRACGQFLEPPKPMKKLDVNIALKRHAHRFQEALSLVGQIVPSNVAALLACGLARRPSGSSEARP